MSKVSNVFINKLKNTNFWYLNFYNEKNIKKNKDFLNLNENFLNVLKKYKFKSVMNYKSLEKKNLISYNCVALNSISKFKKNPNLFLKSKIKLDEVINKIFKNNLIANIDIFDKKNFSSFTYLAYISDVLIKKELWFCFKYSKGFAKGIFYTLFFKNPKFIINFIIKNFKKTRNNYNFIHNIIQGFDVLFKSNLLFITGIRIITAGLIVKKGRPKRKQKLICNTGKIPNIKNNESIYSFTSVNMRFSIFGVHIWLVIL